MFASGQLIPISQNTALFSILGTTYGGNGTSNFALPNMNGTAGMGNGNGLGLTPRVLGETTGETNVTLLLTEIPSHNHLAECRGRQLSTTAQLNNILNATALLSFSDLTTPGRVGASVAMSPLAIGPSAGGSQPHSNVQPYLVVNFCIAVRGIFPT